MLEGILASVISRIAGRYVDGASGPATRLRCGQRVRPNSARASTLLLRANRRFGHDEPNLCAGIDKKAAEMSVWKGEIRLKVRAAAAGPVEFAEPAKVLCVAVRPSAPGRRMRKRAVERAVC